LLPAESMNLASVSTGPAPGGAVGSAVGSADVRDWVAIYRGSGGVCRDYGLVLEALVLPYAIVEHPAGGCELRTPASQASRVEEELRRYAAERLARRAAASGDAPQGGAGAGAIGYGLVLLGVAYCAGIRLFGIDWLAAGAVDAGAGARDEWWRAVTALTLHLDPAHLFGNLLFGTVAGVLCSRRFGAGVAWLSILAMGALGNILEMLVAPVAYRAVGASTAIFAALGLLSGVAWRQRMSVRERWLDRTAPLFAGVSLLALLGAGNAHVDVLGHVLGFSCGLCLGWIYARSGMPRICGTRLQIAAGSLAMMLIAAAWTFAVRSAGA